MKRFFNKKTLASFLTCIFIFSFVLSFGSCKKSVDYFSYVSELRDNIFIAETEEYSLRSYSVVKETPYHADGIAMDASRRIEAYFIAPQGDKNCKIGFTLNGKSYGGDMSYDNVKAQYFWTCTLDVSKCSNLDFSIEYGEEALHFNAKSILNGTELSPDVILQNVAKENAEIFSNLTDKYGFAGEIYIRLIYEENAYYYVGIIDRTGKIYAFLINAVTGKVLAKRIT